MEGELALLDTPKKASLQSRSTKLRSALKDFERNFAVAHDGVKPSQSDIKADIVIAGKYKEYNKIRDVLAGKANLATLEISSPSKKRKTHARAESAANTTQSTPRRKPLRPDDIDPYDAPSSVTPRHVLTAIGPTPQRDGQALGIFDLLSNPGSGRSTQATPSSRMRKRKFAALMGEDDDLENQPTVAQTPSQRSKKSGDLLDHLAGTPTSQLRASRHKHSRTPISDSKKFMLSQFFATPSAIRYANMTGASQDATPRRNRVLGLSPHPKEQGLDATPAYLRRSYSFKDRLLSASSNPSRDNSSDVDGTSPSSVRVGVRRAGKQVRFKPKPLSQIAAEMRRKEEEEAEAGEEGEGEVHDDDLDAMREMEMGDVGGAGVLFGDSQPPLSNIAAQDNPDAPQRVWKKKGQKRTTRRVIMRPSTVKTRDRPASVEASGSEDEEEDVEGSEDELHARPPGPAHGDEDDTNHANSDDEFNDHNDIPSDDEDDDSRPSKKVEPKKHETSASKRATKKPSKSTLASATATTTSKNFKPKENEKPKAKETRKKRTYNPNAPSNQNFRSLKIKNKNSRAKGGGGRGRFGRR